MDGAAQAQALLSPDASPHSGGVGAMGGRRGDDDDDDDALADLDLPPLARRSQPVRVGGADSRAVSAPPAAPAAGEGRNGERSVSLSGAAGGLRQFLSTTVEDPATWFRQIDDEFIKPKLLLDPGDGGGGV